MIELASSKMREFGYLAKNHFVGHGMCDHNVLYYVDELPSYETITALKASRQRDPLSPYLFAIGMEYTSRCLASLEGDKC